jgi:hypothetical protein
MYKEITICLHGRQWECLKPHLTGILCTAFTEAPFLESYDYCIVCDDTDYQKIIAAANAYCPETVNHIRNQHRMSLLS